MKKRLTASKLSGKKAKPLEGVKLQLAEHRKDLNDVMAFCDQLAIGLQAVHDFVEEKVGTIPEPDWGGE